MNFLKKTRDLYKELIENKNLIYEIEAKIGSKIVSRYDNYSNMAKAKRVTPMNGEYLFGYYDKCPWDSTGRYLLSLKIPFATKYPDKKSTAKIGIIDTQNGNKFAPIASTHVWSIQQGCMLQWLGPEYTNKIIYNDFIDNKYVCVIYDIVKKNKTIIHKPVYSVSKDGKKAVTLNFSRLQRLRPGYGYTNIPDKTIEDKYPAEDGIWHIDLEKNESKLIISLKKMFEINTNKNMVDVHHRFNHLEINPEGSRFMFLHRWGNKRQYSRLYTADLDGNDIYCLADDQMVSHCCWKSNTEILSWARKKSLGDHYYLFEDKAKEFKIIGKRKLDEDGHPSFSPNGRYILTDTYPDTNRRRTLIIYDAVEDKRYNLGKFLSIHKYDNEFRCDLHPRWSRNGKKICFDSVHEGRRQMYIVQNPLS